MAAGVHLANERVVDDDRSPKLLGELVDEGLNLIAGVVPGADAHSVLLCYRGLSTDRGEPKATLRPRLPLPAASGPLGSLVRRAARQVERITFTEDDEPAAVLISAAELEDLEDALAVAPARLRKVTGHIGAGVPRRVPTPPPPGPATYAISWEPIAVDLATSLQGRSSWSRSGPSPQLTGTAPEGRPHWRTAVTSAASCSR